MQLTNLFISFGNQTHLRGMTLPVLDSRAAQLDFRRLLAGAFAAAAFGAALALRVAFAFAFALGFAGVLPAPDLPPTVLSLQGVAGIRSTMSRFFTCKVGLGLIVATYNFRVIRRAGKLWLVNYMHGLGQNKPGGSTLKLL